MSVSLPSAVYWHIYGRLALHWYVLVWPRASRKTHTLPRELVKRGWSISSPSCISDPFTQCSLPGVSISLRPSHTPRSLVQKQIGNAQWLTFSYVTWTSHHLFRMQTGRHTTKVRKKWNAGKNSKVDFLWWYLTKNKTRHKPLYKTFRSKWVWLLISENKVCQLCSQ